MTTGAPEPQRDATGTDSARARAQLLRRAAFAAALMVLLAGGLALYEDEAPVPGPLVEAPLPLTRPRPVADTPVQGPPSAVVGGPCTAEFGLQAEEAAREPPAPDEASEGGRIAARMAAAAAEGSEDGDIERADPRSAPEQGAQPAAAPLAGPAQVETRADAARAVAAAAEAAATEAVGSVTAAEAADAADAAASEAAAGEAAAAASARTEGARAPAPRPPQASQSQALKRFQLEIGGFEDLAQADRLRDALTADGHASRVLTRVAVGPYPARAAAREALDKLRRERSLRGVLIAAPGGGLLVQVGVFAEHGNAVRLDRALAEAGYPVLTHARILLGPYTGRPAAEEAAAAVRGAHGVDVVFTALR